MRNTLIRWATVIGAMSRIVTYREHLIGRTYYDRLRFCNAILGPDWMFRLRDIVGTPVIQNARPSWLSFYENDIYQQHMPLDPRAPETDKYLGVEAGATEFAFYAGMGFEGYMLALGTPRRVDTKNFRVMLDDYVLQGIETASMKTLSEKKLSAHDYYHAYGKALNSVFEACQKITRQESISEEKLECTAAACLLFLCGGHQGCSGHIDEQEGQDVRLQTIILCRYVEALCKGEIFLSSKTPTSLAA